MLILLLAGGLTVAAPDTSLRVPGTNLRFGIPLERISTYGAFAPFSAAHAPGAPGAHAPPVAAPPGAVLFEGPARYFGVDAHATLTFRERQLTNIRFAIDPVSAHSVDYIEDQFRRSGLTRKCMRYAEGVRTCDWLGSTLVHVTLDQDRFVADLAPHAIPAGAQPPPSHVAADTTIATPAEASHADTLWLAAGVDSLPAPVATDSCAPVRPDAARSQGVFGRVTVNVLVDTDGRVIDATVQHGIAGLNEAALACARKFRFEPYLWRGHVVRFWHELPLTFLLDS